MKEETFRRKVESRHIVMLSLGGVIGTGLFLSTGYTLEQAGRIGTILSYLVGALAVYLVMLCLGRVGGTYARNRVPFIVMRRSTLDPEPVIRWRGSTG